MKKFLMANLWKVFVPTFIILFTLNPILLFAECTLSHIECRYECIEYYPNGTDCKKSKKICESICDEFDVKISGETPHGSVSNKIMKGLVVKEGANMLIVSGILDQIFVIGGETSGWVIELGVGLELKKGMKIVKHIEVDPNDKKIDSLKGKKVQVSGNLAWRHGVERGDYPVIILDSIKEININ